MKKTRFTELQMVANLREGDEKAVPDVAKKHGVSAQAVAHHGRQPLSENELRLDKRGLGVIPCRGHPPRSGDTLDAVHRWFSNRRCVGWSRRAGSAR